MAEIKTLDLHFLDRPQIIASYLIRTKDAVILVESGPGSTQDQLTKGLKQHKLKPKDVTHVLLTHIHLDHAGAAGWLAQHGAQVFVHEVGARHLIDPSRLWSSATRIYGEEAMQTLWGSILPVPQLQLTTLKDKDTIEVDELKFIAHDTPGHANHHITYQLDDVLFTGDVAAVCVPQQTHIRIPSPPPEFNPHKWKRSIERLHSLKPSRLYLTHFGAFDDARDFLQRLEAELDRFTAFAEEHFNADPETLNDKILAWSLERAAEDGVTDDAVLEDYEFMSSSAASANGAKRYFQKLQSINASA